MLSTSESAGAGGTAIRGFLRVGGATLARHQLALALSLGCERIICIARGATGDVIALQHEAEAAGARFHLVNGPRGLMGLVTATDDLFAFAEGLLAAPDDVSAILSQGVGVVVQPVEAGLAAGFERIDINHAAAGAMRIPARLVERLADLPPDCDTLSALQRIALQAGIAQRPLPAEPRETGRWLLVRDEIEAHAAERSWIRLHTAGEPAATPSALIARHFVRAFGPALLHANSGSSAVAIGAIALILLALGAGWFGYVTLAFCLCALGWLVRKAGGMLARIEADSLHRHRSPLASVAVFEWLADLTMIVVAVWNLPVFFSPGASWRAFVPVMALAMARLAKRLVERDWAGWLGDRMLVGFGFAATAFAGVLLPAMQVYALAIVALAVALPREKNRITTV